MVKKIIFATVLLFTTLSFGASEYDKDIIVKDQSRNDKVEAVFREMMNNYEEENLGGFFSFVSEDRFMQDYMTFYEAIEKDIRVYDILSVDTWVDKITDDGVKRYLYVRWEKRYESTSSNRQITQRGYSRFLFDEINGEYKLIELAGNVFWGASLAEWVEEVPQISGQEVYLTSGGQSSSVQSGGGLLPDLTIENASCPSGFGGAMPVEFDLVNNGADTISGSIEYTYTSFSMPYVRTYNGNLASGESVTISATGNCGAMYGEQVVTIDPNNLIIESNENNNEVLMP